MKKNDLLLLLCLINAIILAVACGIKQPMLLYLLVPLFYTIYLINAFDYKLFIQYFFNVLALVLLLQFKIIKDMRDIVIMGVSIPLLILSLEYIYKKKIQKSASKTNDIVSQILKQITANEKEEKTIQITCKKILKILKENYDIDYCTIFNVVNRRLSIAASNVPEIFWIGLNGYIAQNYSDKGKILTVKDPDQTLVYPTAEQRGIRYMQLIMLSAGGKVNGAVLIENSTLPTKYLQEAEIYEVVLESISLIMEYVKYQDRIYSMAMTDALSGLYNRQYMKERLYSNFNECKKVGKPVTVAMFDIDHFKKVNDTYGHAFGDIVIKTISEKIRKEIREDDIAVRVGGEEILIYYAGQSIAAIEEKIDHLRSSISNIEFVSNNSQLVHVTVSGGVAEYPAHGESLDDIIRCADTALYYSKANGRDRLTRYSD